ncbi:MAG: outer membrane protein assembly factor BamB family protein [Pirellulaceae bacterium]
MLRSRIRTTVLSERVILGAFCIVLAASMPIVGAAGIDDPLAIEAGVCVVVGLPDANDPASLVRLCEGNRRLIYFQSADIAEVAAVRAAAAEARVLGSQIFVEHGSLESIHLADNLADRMWVTSATGQAVSQAEILRVLHPGAKAIVGTQELTKPQPEGIDQWSHLYHGPDNNPSSVDQLARAPYQTQFLAGPLFSPMPEVTVAAGGRIFKAFGHIAHKANQNEVLNSLMGINAYNGTILWRRDLRPGFMIHRSTMIATSDALFLGDDQSCKIIDAASGEVRDEIVIPPGLADGPVWKWMAMQDGVLYALVGGEEIQVDTVTSDVRGIGHWPWGMWKGHEYADPRTNFGFGRTLLAINPLTKDILWTYKDDDYLDSRGLCMSAGRIFFYAPDKFLGCLQSADGKLLWKNQDQDLLAAIGPNGPAQHYVTGYATQSYIKCNAEQLFFAGPQRDRLVVASADDGHLLWQKSPGNLQLVLRDDGFYGVGPQMGADDAGAKFSFDGQRLASLPMRRACTRATGSIDSIFYRAPEGTVRVDVASNTAEHIAPMRPPCQDGVIISDGLLFWGPWMCGCQLSLYGHICLGPADTSRTNGAVDPALQPYAEDASPLAALDVAQGDWPTFRHDSWRSSYTSVNVPESVEQRWSHQLPAMELPTAPVMAGGLTFVADRSGAVTALDDQGRIQWTTLTGGPVYYAPAIANGRLFVGSADGRVYAMEAATGRLLWSYRVAPQARWMPVYGKLISTWPVAGGVLVEEGVVYAAAGIAHYDGTYVVALDAVTGQPRWRNDTSGVVSQQINNGVSLQGELQIRGDELQFLGGGVYQFARYDRRTGKCLNEPWEEVSARFQTAFYPYFPMYAKYESLHHTFRDGRTLMYAPSYDGSQPTPLALLEPASAVTDAPSAADRKGNARRDAAARAPQRTPVWQTPQPRLFTAFIITPEILLAGGPDSDERSESILSAMRLSDGSLLWQKSLPALPVKGGLAIDQSKHIVATLENGEVLCFALRNE